MNAPSARPDRRPGLTAALRLGCLAVHTACHGPPSGASTAAGGAPPGGDIEPDGVVATAPVAATDTPSAGAAAWNPRRPGDLGIGLVYFPMGTPPLDLRLPLRSAPDASASIVAEFRFVMEDGGSWSYSVTPADGSTVTSNLLEFGYEESGLPLDSLSRDGGWARVVYAYDGPGAMRHGWASLGEGVEHILWRDWLPSRAAFFLDADAAELTTSPGGPAVAFRLERTAAPPPWHHDYHIEPDSVAGDWLRVRVVTPSDACMPEVTDRREVVAWTRFLDERGRPLVWYYSRGC